VCQRLVREGQWPAAEIVKNDLMIAAKSKGLPGPAAKEWAYTELDRMYPPLPAVEKPPAPEPAPEQQHTRVQGLGDIPAAWPTLPANASLQAEVGWVQANRLAVVEERGGGTVVHLDRAHEPAPSRAALGWLETSIRSYAKYVDIVARSLQSVVDEQDHVHHERMAIDEIRGLLREMDEDTA